MDTITLDQALDTVMQLSFEQQEILLDIVRSRHLENRRKEIAGDADELTGLIAAVALVRPSKDIRDVKVKSVRKKWKTKAFAVQRRFVG